MISKGLKQNNKIKKDKELVQNFSQYIRIITRNTGVNFIPDTSKETVARVVPGDNGIRFNPVFSFSLLEQLYGGEEGTTGFKLNTKHLILVILHELNHIINHYQLKNSSKVISFNGEHLSPIDYYKAVLKEYGLELKFFIDVIEDIDANNQATILQAPILEIAKREIYRNISMRHRDFRELPLHTQFLLCCFRESMIEDEKCEVDGTVREIITHINKPGASLEKIKNPLLSYDEQLPEIVNIYRDYYLRLKQRDKKKQQELDSLVKQSSKQGGNPEVDPLGGEDNVNLPHLLEESLNDEEKNNQENIDQKEGDKAQKEDNKAKDETKIPIPKKVLDKISKSIENKFIDDQKTPEELNLENSIRKERGEEKKFDMEEIKWQIKQQENLKNKIKLIKDSNGNSVYERITNQIFSKIIEKKKYKTIHEDSPRHMSEGGQFSPHHFVEGMMYAKAGDYDPLIMQQDRPKTAEKEKPGSFFVTFILDGSASMYGAKNTQQALSTLLMLYAIQDIRNRLGKEDLSIIDNFSVDSQVLMFKGFDKVDTLKSRGKDITRKDMIRITQELKFSSGNSNGTDALLKYYNSVANPFNGMSSSEYEEWKNNVKIGKKKEIVFVLSDGEFNAGGDPANIINKLRNMGIVVCGIGISKTGSAIVKLFGSKKNDKEKDKYGFGILCPNEKDLCRVLNELLASHLENWIGD